MPIDADRFEELDDDDALSPEVHVDEILSFFEANNDQAFTQSEVAEATGVKRDFVGPTLVRLRESDRVDHRGKYWQRSDEDVVLFVLGRRNDHPPDNCRFARGSDDGLRRPDDR